MARVLSVSLVLAFLLAPPAASQDVAFEGTLSDSVVVTASRMAEELRESGRRVSVWTARDIERLPVTSFDELLRAVGGVEAHSRGGFGVQSDLSIRGSTFNGVLLLLDDARLNDPMTGHFLAESPVPLSEIARIEVLRGQATALYGPDALGGVIQIFTYAGLRDRATPASGGEGELRATAGQHRLYDMEGAVRYFAPEVLVSGGGTVEGTEGQPIRDEEGEAIVGSEGSVRTDFSRQAGSVAMSRDLGSKTLYARAGADNRDFGAFQFYSDAPADTARETTSTLWVQARLGGEPSAVQQWQLQLSARQHEDAYVFNPETPANRHTSRQVNADARLTRVLLSGLSMTGGLTGHVRSIDSNSMGGHHDAAAGAFLTARWQPGSRLTLHASGRADADPGYGLELTPQAGLAYNLGAATLRGNVGRAVRAPNYVERYLNTEVEDIRGRDVGSPDVQAERAWAYEAGLDLYPLRGFSLHATAFQRDTDDLIDYAMASPSDTVFLARNLHEVRTRGLELDAEAFRDLGLAHLRLGATYTFLEADLGDVEDGVTYKYALTHARHLGQLSTTLDVGGTSAGIQLIWKEPLDGEAYHVVHARLGRRIPLGGSALSLSGEIRNLFDLEYAEIFNAPMPRRWWLLGAELSF